MSTGVVKQYTDFSNTGGGDTGTNDSDSIQPFNNGEDVEQTVLRRSPENLRLRTEVIRGLFDDTLYCRDADRSLLLAGPGAVTWPGSTTAAASGIPVLSDNLYLVPFLTPGAAQTAPVPPVASHYGSITLLNGGSAAGLVVQSLRRSYAGGDKINITVVADGTLASGACVATTTDDPARTIVLKVNNAQLSTVIAALNGIIVDSPAVQLVSATLAGGALSTDLLLAPQAKQYMAGNYDGEGHALTPAAVAAFFAGDPSSALAEGDTLCIQYTQMVDSNPVSTSGRRQSIPENSNTAVPASALFNSRVHPEKLVNALPVCKVINNRLIFISGAQVPPGGVSVDLGSGAAADVSYAGGPNWADGTTNPATTVENQLDKIVTDLATGAGASKIAKTASAAWADATANGAGTLGARVDKIITDLATGDGASKIAKPASAAWADATANPSGTLGARLDKIISDLASAGGAAKIMKDASAAWADGTTNPADTLQNRIDKIISDLGGALVDAAARLHGVASGQFMTAGTLRAQLNQLDAGIWARGFRGAAAVRWTGSAYSVDWAVGLSYAGPSGSPGVVNMSIAAPLSSVTTGVCLVIPDMVPGGGFVPWTARGNIGGGGATAQANLYNAAGSYMDGHFYMVVFGA